MSGSNYHKEALHKLSNGRLAVTQETHQGSYVIASEALEQGQILLECPSASIALDPAYRRSHCGFCAGESTTNACTDCHLISICTSCQNNGAAIWHTQGGECKLLACLVDSFTKVFPEYQGMTASEAAQQVQSIYVITMRLVLRRQLSRSPSPAPCPLPEIDWKLFDLLYSSPLPPASSADSNNVVTAIATLLQTMNAKIQQHQQQSTIIAVPPFSLNPQECLDVWNKARGCCHAITDLTRPLGSQSLGMALFWGQSFYNHGCAPNAFLSCLVPLPTNSSAKCSVVARVVGCSPVAKGDPVLLSYIPLSGLCQ